METKSNPNIGSYLGDAVYGALDGTVTTFAVMAGAVGANLSTPIIIILGLANLFADGFSMAVGSFLSEKSKQQYLSKSKKDAVKTIAANHGDAESELREIYEKKGFHDKDLSRAVNIIKSRKKTFINEILYAEGMSDHSPTPIITSIVTFIAFIFVGITPLLPLLFLSNVGFWQILVFVAVILFIVGSLRSKVTDISWWRGGLEIMVAGIGASLIAFFIGEFLSQTYLNL